MAKRNVVVSDQSGAEIADGKGAVVKIYFNDARLGQFEMDLTEDEGKTLSAQARKVAKRGRRSKAQIAADAAA